LGKNRILATELSPLSQIPWGDQELYYPKFLFGSWNVTATLRRKNYPYGTSLVPTTILRNGIPLNPADEHVGSVKSYEARYYSTLANTIENQLIVQLGLGVPQSKIIADRAYNTVSLSRCYSPSNPIQSVEWDPRADATRLSLTYPTQTVTDDMRPLGPQRGEIFYTARKYEYSSKEHNSNNNMNNSNGQDENTNVYACTEQCRSVLVMSRQVLVSDTESITEFRRIAIEPNIITATNRIAVYLTPNPNSREGVAWQQVGGKAVAFFDYDLYMKRNLETFIIHDNSQQEEKVQRACVPTPRGFVQCE
jgi:hypothetical protein